MFFIYIFRNLIEFIYVKYNIRSVSFKRDFSELSYPEKLFLTLFQRNNLFKKSIANLYSNDKLFNFRRYKYPLVFFFHLYYDKIN